ncbi:hypothetical protein ACKC9G_08475 [Pokkaliibacter sp. CJK22405]|uniref:hypothetical protein n=1 Tax=Pokkaliibacter sp. CJK22405 TaxID=3384615 RepID=UPI0039851567
MHFVVLFLLTLIVIVFCLWVFTRMGVPRYRPSIVQIEQLLQGVVDGYTRRDEWVMFLGCPLHHDPELEIIRIRCIGLEEGDDDHPPCTQGINGYLYNREGRERAEQILRSIKLLRSQRELQHKREQESEDDNRSS